MSDKPTPPQKLCFRLTRDDFAAFEQLPEELAGWNRVYFLGPAVLAGLIYGAYGEAAKRALPFELNDSVWWFAAMAGLVGFSYATMSLLLTMRYFRRVKNARVPETETLIESFEDRFTVRQDSAAREFAWDKVVVIPAKGHVFLCPAPRDPIIVPLRAFASEQEMQAFARFAEAAGRDADNEPNKKDKRHVA